VNGKRIGTYVFLLLALLAVYVLIKNLVVVLVSAGVAAVVAWWVSRGDDPEDQPVDEGAAGPEWVETLRGLAALNARAREQACPRPVTEKLETIIDALRRLIPELNTHYVGSELTWTVNRMASDYLRRLVEPYCALAPAAMLANQDEFLQSLVGLEAEVKNIAGLVATATEGDFKAKAAFLRARFLEDPG
jgi:hypothetical protein